MAGLDKDRRSLVMDSLKTGELDDRQLIDLLLMLLDDWEIRLEVVRMLQRRSTNEHPPPAIINVKTVGIDKKQGTG